MIQCPVCSEEAHVLSDRFILDSFVPKKEDSMTGNRLEYHGLIQRKLLDYHSNVVGVNLFGPSNFLVALSFSYEFEYRNYYQLRDYVKEIGRLGIDNKNADASFMHSIRVWYPFSLSHWGIHRAVFYVSL